jgi:hypothetical protein
MGVPLAVGLWWWGFGDKTVKGRDLPQLIAWPVIYGLYALLRGALA